MYFNTNVFNLVKCNVNVKLFIYLILYSQFKTGDVFMRWLFCSGSWRRRCQSWCDREHTDGRSQTAPESETHNIVFNNSELNSMYTNIN